MTTFALLATVQEKGCGMVLTATSARELAVIQSNTGIRTMTNVKKMAKNEHEVWTFPPYPPIPWTKAQEQAYNQAQRAQLPEAPL